MFLASSKDLGDIGNTEKCEQIENAHYVGLDIYPNELPVNLMLGFCLPTECTIDILNKVSDKINPLIFKAVQAVGIPYLTEFNFSAVMYFQSTENAVQSFKDNGMSMTYTVYVILGILVFTVVMATTY